jgi:flagellar motor switch protein FliN/FliY
MTFAPTAVDLATALSEAAQVVLPSLPVAPGAARLTALAPEQLAEASSSTSLVAVAVRVSGAIEGELALALPEGANISLAGAAADPPVDVVATWGPVLGEVVSALAGRVGALQPEAVRRVEVSAALAVAADASQDAVAILDDEDRVLALVVANRVPQALIPQQARAASAFQPLAPSSSGVDPRRLHLLRDVVMGLSVELGRTRMTVRELLSLTPGTIVQLDRAAGSPVDLLVNGTLLARGEVVVVDEEFAVRVSEIVGPDLEGRLGS